MYPGRLAHEVHWLEAESAVAAVSVCAAATRDDELIGVLRPRADSLPTVEQFSEPKPPPFVFPTSMIRADLARATGFDPKFRRSQDSDFLIRALLGRHYALSAEVLYAYSTAAQRGRATVQGSRNRFESTLRHWRENPVHVAQTVVATSAKRLVYRAAGMLGMDQKLVARRWSPASAEVESGYQVARAAVLDAQNRFWS